ncbi:MAG: hypothetical protein UZ19_OD1000582 [Parcubacteria bacterium OLB19]|nr:MAG: hypothetical protein UZ19_OD1000582 [Parcubacteria bacterium OLB19]
MLLIYLLGLLAPIAKITGMDPLCNYVYNKQIKTECLTSNYINIQGDIYKTEAGDFTVVVDNRYVNNLTVVDNKIAYTLIDRKFKDVITTVVYDGKHLGEYEYVYKLYNIGGKLVYLAQIGSSYVLFYDEKKHMNFNKSISDLVDINGKLAYAVYDRDHPYVYFNDKKYNNDFVLIDSLMAYSGQPTFRGSKNQQSYIVVGDREYGPYEVVYDMKIEDGHLLALIKQKGEVLAFVDGKTQWMGKGYKIERNSSFVDSDNRISLINGEFSTVVYKNGNAILIVGDKEVSKVSYYDSGPYKINNKLAYISLDSKGSSQFIIDGKVKSTFNEPIYDIAVSESGKIAVKVKDDRDMFKVYINNEVVYKEDNGFIIDRFSKLKFIGDKLIFDIKKTKLRYFGTIMQLLGKVTQNLRKPSL